MICLLQTSRVLLSYSTLSPVNTRLLRKACASSTTITSYSSRYYDVIRRVGRCFAIYILRSKSVAPRLQRLRREMRFGSSIRLTMESRGTWWFPTAMAIERHRPGARSSATKRRYITLVRSKVGVGW